MAALTPLAQQYLNQTRPWVRFMSIVIFVMSGLMVLMGLVMLLIGIFGGLAASNTGGLGPLGSAIGMGMMALLYLALACVYIAPGVYLSRYANAIQHLKANGTAGALEDALKHQKSFWRFVGILTAVGLVVGVVAVGLAIMAGVIGAMMAARS
jgi:hypothetical protein